MLPDGKLVGNSRFDLGEQGISIFLGTLESKVMEAAWRHDRPYFSVREIYSACGGPDKLAYTTVSTTMSRLSKKNLLRVDLQQQWLGRRAKWEVTMSRSDFVEQMIRMVLVSLRDSFPEEMGRLEGKWGR